MSALVIFSPDVRRMATFYERVLEADPRTEPSGDVRLMTPLEEVLIHSIPKKIAAGISIRTPPVPRGDSALKPVFDVRSLANTLQRVRANGGVVTNRTFRLDGVTRHDVLDPDGNVIQFRGPAEDSD